MFRKLGLFLVLIICTISNLRKVNGQQIEPRVIRKASNDCSASLAVSPDVCCKLPMIFDESIMSKCKTDFGTNEPPPPPVQGVPPPGCCVAECILNTTKILVDGKFDKAQALTIIKNSVKDQKWIDVINKALDTCEKEHTEMAAKFPGPMPPSDPANHKCHPISGAMVACVLMNMFQNCPDYSSEANCATVKTQIATCPMALMKNH